MIDGLSVDPGSRKVEMMPLDRLVPTERNARTHSQRQIRQIADSIQRFGFNSPVLIDDRGEVIAGHGRVAAVRLLGWSAIPTLRISHLSPAEQRAYVIADNRLADATRSAAPTRLLRNVNTAWSSWSRVHGTRPSSTNSAPSLMPPTTIRSTQPALRSAS